MVEEWTKNWIDIAWIHANVAVFVDIYNAAGVAIEAEGYRQTEAHRCCRRELPLVLQQAGWHPLVFAGRQPIPTVGKTLAHVVAPATGTRTVAGLGTQNVHRIGQLIGSHIEKLAARANGREQIGHNAAGL